MLAFTLNGKCFFIGGEILKELAIKELIRSKEEKRILTGKISGIEDEYYKLKNENISCAIVWYKDIKVLIPSTHLGIDKINKSIIRGMLGAEIDFIVMEIDTISNIAIASRKDAMQLRAELELPKLKKNDVVRVRILSVGIKHIIVDLYGKETIIKAEDLQHTYILNCKDIYSAGEYLKVRVRNIDMQNNIIVQLDNTNVTCLIRIPARFNNYPHYLDNVLIRVTEIKEDKKFIYGYLMRII